MEERVVAFFAVFVLVMGVGFWALTAIALRQVVGVVCTPVASSVKQLSPGVVKVRGVCAPIGEPMFSPLAQRACVWWSYALQVRHYSRRAQRDVWRAVTEGSTKASFLLSDETGTVVVNPDLVSVTSFETRALPADAVPKVTLSELGRLTGAMPGDVDPLLLPPGDRQWAESFLPVGCTVWVHGKVQRRESPGEGLEIVGVEGSPMLVSTGGQRRGLAVIAGALGWSALVAAIMWGFGVRQVVQLGAPVAAMVLAAAPLVGLVGLALHGRQQARRAASSARLSDRPAG
jgi:hypothetical protein